LPLPSASWLSLSERDGWVGQSVAAVEISRESSGSASGFRSNRCGLMDSIHVIGFDGRFIVRLLVCETLEHGRREDCIEILVSGSVPNFTTHGWTSLGFQREE